MGIKLLSVTAIFAMFTLSSCGLFEPGEEVLPYQPADYFPMQIGDQWTYHHINPLRVDGDIWRDTMTVTVTGEEIFDGRRYMRFDVNEVQERHQHFQLYRIEGQKVYHVFAPGSLAAQDILYMDMSRPHDQDALHEDYLRVKRHRHEHTVKVGTLKDILHLGYHHSDHDDEFYAKDVGLIRRSFSSGPEWELIFAKVGGKEFRPL